MRSAAITFVMASFLVGSALAQTTQPAANSAPLELRATQAFNRGEYALALPMLKKLEQQMGDDAKRVGPIQERIRVCEKNLSAPPADAQAAITGRPDASAPPSAESRKAHPAPKDGEIIDLAIKELGNFEYDADTGGNIPADVKRLSGAKVRLHGFMIPMDQAENITQFALVPSLFACCFGQPPQVQHTVVVNCPKGKALSYCPDELVIEGKLCVDEKKDEGYITSIFQVEVSSVKPAPK